MNSGELNLKRVYEVEGRITDLGLKNSATKLIPEKCVLIGLAGQGKTRGTVAMNYVELCTNQSIAAILPSETVDEDFVYHNLDLRYNELRSLSTGDGARGGLNLTLLRNLWIPLPPLKLEQTAIATALNNTDDLIINLEKLIAKKRAIKQGAMQELLKPKDGWEVKTLKEIIVSLSSGKSNTQSQKGNYPIYGSTGIIGWENYFDYEGEKILIARVGANAGTANRVSGKYLVSDNTLILSISKNIDIDFLYFTLIKLNLNSLVFGSGQPLITGGQLKELYISFPKAKMEQTRIAQSLIDIDIEIQELEKKLAKYKVLKQGMMQSLLTGKIRLV